MRLGLKTFLATLLLAALVVPAATAKPGNGHGGGKPSWAGSSSSHAGGGGHGKPEWAGRGHGHGKKAETAHGVNTVEAEDATAQTEEGDAPKHDNPAWICKFERDMTDADAFAEKYGTNENGANAFGMCVSEEAQARDGVSEDAQPEETAAECEVSADEGDQADDETAGDETVAEDETVVEETVEGDETVDDETAEQEEEDASGECAAAGDEQQVADDGQGEDEDEQGEDEDADEPEDTGAAALASFRLFF